MTKEIRLTITCSDEENAEAIQRLVDHLVHEAKKIYAANSAIVEVKEL